MPMLKTARRGWIVDFVFDAPITADDGSGSGTTAWRSNHYSTMTVNLERARCFSSKRAATTSKNWGSNSGWKEIEARVRYVDLDEKLVAN